MEGEATTQTNNVSMHIKREDSERVPYFLSIPTKVVNELNEAVNALALAEFEFAKKMPEKQAEDEMKKLRKKYKKTVTDFKDFAAANEGTPAKILEKLNKFISDCRLYAEEYANSKKSYDNHLVNLNKTKEEKAKLYKQKDNYENLHKQFSQQYQQQIDQNKKLQEEEKARRQELADQFQQKIRDIQVSVEEKSRDRIQKEKENEILKEKLHEANRQAQTTELIFGAQMKKKELEMELQEAKLGQELNLIKQQAELVQRFKEEIEKQKETDVVLTERLDVFLQQDKNFSDTMMLSNEKFVVYKGTFDSLAEGQKKLDVSINDVKRKCEKTDLALIDIIEKNVKLKEELSKQQGQLSGLESLLVTLEKQLAEKTAQQ